MQIIVNGQPCQHADNITVSQLLETLNLEPRRVAVELNRNLVTRSKFDQTTLRQNDQLEIVTLVGGG